MFLLNMDESQPLKVTVFKTCKATPDVIAYLITTIKKIKKQADKCK